MGGERPTSQNKAKTNRVIRHFDVFFLFEPFQGVRLKDPVDAR